MFGKQFSDEYRWQTSMANPHWRSVRMLTMGLSFGRDCVFPILPATQVDHLHYAHLGRELPWLDVVPLHAGTHEVVTALRSMGLKPIVNPILRLCYAVWISPWILVPWFALHLIGLAPIGPWEVFRDFQHLVEQAMPR